MCWRVVVEQQFYFPDVKPQDGQLAEFTTETLAKRFARICLGKGHNIRAEEPDLNITVKPNQIAAWILGSPREMWPE
jgi:hypothetical protein